MWFGLVAPAKTPKETVAAAHRLVQHGAACAGGQAKLTAQALYPNPKCGADFDAHLRRQSDLYTRLIRELNIKTE